MLLSLVSTGFLGPLGLAGCLLMELVRFCCSRNPLTFEAWYERLFPRTSVDRAQALYTLIAWKRVKPSKVSTVAPFADVLDLGRIDQKQSVITLIADHFKPELASALQRALNDPEPAIRVQAATAAARIENDFLQQSVLLQRILAQEPGNPSILRKMALHHETYARSGLLDTGRASGERSLALEINMKLLQTFPGHPDLVGTTAALLLDLQRPKEAIRLLKPWIRSMCLTCWWAPSPRPSIVSTGSAGCWSAARSAREPEDEHRGRAPSPFPFFHGTPPMRDGPSKGGEADRLPDRRGSLSLRRGGRIELDARSHSSAEPPDVSPSPPLGQRFAQGKPLKLPPNVVGMTEIPLQQVSARASIISGHQTPARISNSP